MQYSRTYPIETPCGPAAICLGRHGGQLWAWVAEASEPRHRWPGAADYHGDPFRDPRQIDLVAVFGDGGSPFALADHGIVEAIASYLQEEAPEPDLDDVAARLYGIAKSIDQIISECDLPSPHLALLACHIRLEAERIETPEESLAQRYARHECRFIRMEA